MRVVEEFPFKFTEVEHFWIPLPDGTRLAARMWRPDSERPVPAIVEYIPYRKRWGTRHRDEPMHRYFAGHGYAAVRIDLRGSGESDGLLLDEYTPQEQQDGADALAWLAAQPWCDGNLGMIGKSWGGFAALQIAALQPPALKAVIAVCASDDRYADDAHYMGGCLLTENLVWGSVLFTLSATPPDPQIVGPDWRRIWRERLDRLPLYAQRWLSHPTRDDYWKQASVSEEYSRIRCPVYAVSGWADGYSNAVPRMLAGLSCPRRGLIGPWAHVYPHEGVPGPAIGFLQEAMSWFDHWMRGRELPPTPMLRAWMQQYVPPAEAAAMRPGRWVAEQAWPSPHIQPRELPLAGTRTISTPLTVGQAAGAWCGFGVEGDEPGDQVADDALSECYDTLVSQPMEILGAPLLRLRVSCDKPFGQLLARLCDVAEPGSLRVSYGVLNLQHRDGHEAPAPLVPGRVYDITLRLNDCAHAFAPGHTLRVALSTSYWPVVWPERESFTLTVYEAALVLPVRPPTPGDSGLADFEPPAQAHGVTFNDLETPIVRRELTRQGQTLVYRNVIDAREDGGPALSRLEPIDLEIGHSIMEEMRVTQGDPGSAVVEVTQEVVTRREGWHAHVRTEHRLSTENGALVLRASVETWEHDIAVFSRLWEERFPP
ncbi:MAG: CocE/NonD family hydrolase [Planctomycetes bacterium]|nr:CocE/NonD family hydrolase [Planctomycetota bacterium]